ncbi:mite allergen Der f 7-like [Melitaea cinxia]|uniref:mite allergen Der f 7-like n=1 Tax=Melitaea cinxia TaxID=113334 RepID=UPI001E27046D|nr:mite allergen Der f 7-like [Melitaea cinxia]
MRLKNIQFHLRNITNMKTASKAIILIFLVAAAEANTIKNVPAPKWNNGLSAKVNDYVDNTISMLVPFMQQNGLDPMELPAIEEGFEVRILLITYSAWLKLNEGQLTGLVNVVRSGDQNVNYFEKNLRVRVQLRFSDLEFAYSYLVQVMGLGPTGKIVASLNYFDVIADVLIDFNNDEIQLQQFSITQRGTLTVRLIGNVLYTWLLNPLINVVTRILNGLIISVVELTIRNVFRGALGVINNNVREIVDLLESYNYRQNVLM